MRIATWNILHGQLLNSNNLNDAAAVFSECVAELDADLLVLQEVDQRYPRSANLNQTQIAASAMKTPYWAFAPVFYIYGEGADDQREPSTGADIITESNPTDRGGYGISIISKIPVLKWERLELSRAKFGKFMNISEGRQSKRFYAKDHQRIALAAHLETLIAINVHLSFIWPFNYFQFLQVKRWARNLEKETGKSVFILGDFNLASWVNGRQWKSLLTELTFPIWKPDRQIDYILTRGDFEIRNGAVTAFDISDHLAVQIEFTPRA